jgi:hypothetical protein
MKPTVVFAATLFALSATGAGADVFKGKCDGSKCDAFELAEKSIVKADDKTSESLAFARINTWVQDGDKKTDEGEDWGYIFCSKARPALIVQNDRKYSVMFLAPQIAEEYNTRINNYVIYFEACHSRGNEVALKKADLAKELGYEVTRTESSEMKPINKPESLFWWSTPGKTRVATIKSKAVYASKANAHHHFERHRHRHERRYADGPWYRQPDRQAEAENAMYYGHPAARVQRAPAPFWSFDSW